MEKNHKNIPLSLFFHIVDKISELVLFVTLGGLFLVVLIQIAGRILGIPAPWTEEGTRFLFLWMMFIALAYGFRYSESARVSLLVNMLPKPLKKATGFLYIICTIGFFLFIVIFGISLVQQQVQMKEMGAAILIPMWIIGISVPISGVLGILSVIQSLIEQPEKIFGGENE